MKLTPPQRLEDMAAVLGARFVGSPNHLVSGINEIHRVENGDLTFVDVAKYFKKALNSAATTILINAEVEPPEGKALIISDDPFRDYNRLTEHYQPRAPFTSSVRPTLDASVRLGQNVHIGRGCEIGANVELGHNVVIGNGVRIGEGTVIYPNVTLYDNVTIGKHCCIQAGAVLGAEAFYFKKRPYGRDKMLTKGSVVLEDWVEVGANTTIDRGVSADTRIGEHTKIDNLVQIGHDTVVGKFCVIAAQVGLAGVITIEDDVILWGQVGIASDITIGRGAVLLAKSGVISDLPGGKTYFGMVAKEWKKKWREYVCLERLPDLFHKLENLPE